MDGTTVNRDILGLKYNLGLMAGTYCSCLKNGLKGNTFY